MAFRGGAAFGRCSRRELGWLVAGLALFRRNLARAEGPGLGELLAHCDSCVVGQVVSASAGWVVLGRRRRIATEHRFVVERALDGSAGAGEVLRVRTLGGRVGDFAQRVMGEAELRMGEPVLLLLTRAEAGVYVVTGMERGRFGLQRDAGGVMRVRAHYEQLDSASSGANAAPPRSAAAAPLLDGASLEQAEEILAAARWGQDAR